MEGRIRAIFVGQRRGDSKNDVARALLRRDHGIEGDAHAGSEEGRQLTLLSAEAIDVVQPPLPDRDWGALRVNLITENIALAELGLGRRVRLGSDAVAQVVQIGWECPDNAECRRPEDLLRRTEGVIMRVAKGGDLKPGDSLTTDPDLDRLRYAVVTLSDRASSGESEDLSGPLVGRLLEEAIPSVSVSYRIMPDDEMKLASHLMTLCDEQIVDLILTTGGTGLSPRDRTPEATQRVIERDIPGIAEAIRAEGLKHTHHAMLSRAVTGLRGRTLIINLSGSPRAVREQLDVVLPILPHAVEVAAGVKVSCARP